MRRLKGCRSMPEPQLLMVQVTDIHGHVESEPLVVRVEGGFVHLELDDGRSMLVDLAELRGVVGQEREAA